MALSLFWMANLPYDTPIVIIAFRRADLLIETLNSVEKVRPRMVYFVQDWYDEFTPEYAQGCHEVSTILLKVQWPCEIVYIKSGYNMGLKKRVESGLHEVFRQVDSAIVLEDDVQISVDGLIFMQNRLVEFANDKSCWHINASNFVQGLSLRKDQFRFSQYAHSWGWGTWADRWSKYDGDLKFWPEYSESASFVDRFEYRSEMKYWKQVFDAVYFGRNSSSWAYPWLASMWFHNGRAISPNVNFVTNIGFDPRATHTTQAPRQTINFRISDITSSKSLEAPEIQCVNTMADRDEYLYHFGGRLRRLKNSYVGKILNQIRIKILGIRSST
jgi:hypothetical protein